jgi:membrane-associated protein
MSEVIELLRSLTDPEKLRALLTTVLSGWWAYAALSAIVFAETGLLIGFFLPGDSLLFTVGVVAGAGDINIALMIGLLAAAAIIGDAVGFSLGRNIGPAIFDRPDSRLFRQEHVRKTHEFYEKHGGKTIVYARFVPIIRTFAPFIAGVANMSYRKFVLYNIAGGIGWVVLMIMSGYYLGNVPFIRRHFEKVVIGIVVVSVLPVILEVLKSRRKDKVSV